MNNPVAKLQRTAEEYRKLDSKDKRRFWSDGLLNNALYILMVIFIIYTAVKNSNFVKPGSIINIVSLAAASLPMALGIGGCIVLTGTDLSAGRVVGLTAAIAGTMLQSREISRRMFQNLPAITPGWILLVVLMVLVVGAIIGLINGFFVAKFSLHPFIVTLATQLITYGLILLFFMLNGNNGQPVSGLSDEYKAIVSSPFLKFETAKYGTISIPWYVFYAVLLTALIWFVWNKTTFGKNMFAVGSNAEAARVSGVNVFWTTVLVHTLAGALYGFTGFIEGARISSITQATGLNYECDAIAACVIGGVSFVGGTGKISGIVLGVFVLRIIFVALNMLGIDPSLQYIIKGGIILAACSLDMRKYLVRK
ncbi:MAG: beta-methylgalactoside transporter [Candidatus Limivicinus sp.]|nr:beta-methylgalactoside transporter [Candidatus Limivicinus sp.]